MHAFIETQKAYMRTDIPPFRPGDTLRVNVRVKEGEKERLQAFEGVCIARRGSGVSETFTVRKISNGVGVERIFPVHSPMIGDIQVIRRGRVRRAKLYYLRGKVGKKARVRELRGQVAEAAPVAAVEEPVEDQAALEDVPAAEAEQADVEAEEPTPEEVAAEPQAQVEADQPAEQKT